MNCAKLKITPEVFVSLIPDECFQIKKSEIPTGAKVVDAYYDGREGCFVVVMSHESFPELPDGADPTDLGAVTIAPQRTMIRLASPCCAAS